MIYLTQSLDGSLGYIYIWVRMTMSPPESTSAASSMSDFSHQYNIVISGETESHTQLSWKSSVSAT